MCQQVTEDFIALAERMDACKEDLEQDMRDAVGRGDYRAVQGVAQKAAAVESLIGQVNALKVKWDRIEQTGFKRTPPIDGGEASRSDKTVRQIVRVAKLLQSGHTFSEAAQMVANQHGLWETTVRDACTRRLELRAEEFRVIATDDVHLANYLLSKYPQQAELIRELLE
jgi:hypothetical protein